MNTRLMFVAVALVLGLSTQSAIPQPAPGATVSYIGTGTLTCGTFIEHKEAGNREQLALFVQWTWGFMSAYTFRAQFVRKWQGPSSAGNLSALPESATVLLYLEKHCREHPLDQVIDATIALVRASGGNVIWK